MLLALRQFMRRQRTAFAGGVTLVSDRLPSDVVLVLAPHPDDEAIGLGGALALYLENRSEITVLFDSNVAPGLDWTFRPEQRGIDVASDARRIAWDARVSVGAGRLAAPIRSPDPSASSTIRSTRSRTWHSLPWWEPPSHRKTHAIAPGREGRG